MNDTPAETRTHVVSFRADWRNWTRITTVRVVVQTGFFALFFAFVLLTSFANLENRPGLQFWLSKFLEVDPLISIATALATHTVYRGLLWSLVILIPTLFLGRFFCGWVCPYGSLHHFVGWLGGRGESPRPNQYRRAQEIKYYVLVGLVVAALFGALQIGWLDPLCLLHRSLTGAALPALQMPAPQLFGAPRLHQGAWLIGAILFGLVAANLVWPRFFCRVLCPLGALLGILSRVAWWRIERDPQQCQGCDRCRVHCEGAADPHDRLRKAECLVCFNCIEECPEGALNFAWLPPQQHEVTDPDVTRRRLLFGGVAGLLFVPFTRTGGKMTRDFSSRVIRPPGAVEELEFLERCLKCEQCAQVCPTNVIQPALFESGVEGLWTPVLNFRIGHCQLHCTACGQVCPTGAIQRISIPEKLGQDDFAEAGPIILGTAHVDPGRCLPHSKNTPCVVCEEVCPTSPKAIYGERVVRVRPDGAARELSVPRVDIERCIGCGICENVCPVIGDRRAIYVTAEGESRSRAHPQPDRNRTVRPV